MLAVSRHDAGFRRFKGLSIDWVKIVEVRCAREIYRLDSKSVELAQYWLQSDVTERGDNVKEPPWAREERNARVLATRSFVRRERVRSAAVA